MNTTMALDALGALAQETRLNVFRLLVQAGPSGLPAGDIAVALTVRQNTLSTHLGLLVSADLISRKREGRSIRYYANYPQMNQLLRYLIEDCCAGHKAVCTSLGRRVRA